ncbi:MAG TPA: TetR/AcrR family transcriptional regulator [Burkholderiales bacterium]
MDVRTRILEAALGLLAAGGELTQPRLARAAGVRQSHLTYYFPTVTDLMQAVARHSFESLAKELGGRGAAGIAAATLDKRRVRLMLALVLAADRDASLKPRMRAFVKEIRARIAPLLDLQGEDLAFLHTVVVGAAVLQLARDNAEARREARMAIDKAILCVARR